MDGGMEQISHALSTNGHLGPDIGTNIVHQRYNNTKTFVTIGTYWLSLGYIITRVGMENSHG